MRFVIGVCTDCTPSYERTLPANTHTHVRRGSVHVRLRAWKKTSGSADIYGQIWDKDKRSIENRFSLFSGQYVFSLFRFPEKDRWNP